jgi:lipopolysaccharide export LptBFGC system permease protein LptF
VLKILQRYVLREVLVPAAMALGILTFLVLTRTIFTESDQFAGVLSLGASLRLLVYILPTFLTLTVPMALLVGVLLGIGRLTVDSEIKACRTHGVNLFRTFLPVLVLAAGMAALEVWNGLYFAPRMMGRSFAMVQEVAYNLVNALEPGKFQGDLNFQGRSAVLYFQDKDPDTGVMSKIYVSLDTPAGGLDAIGGGGKTNARKRPAADAASPTSATLAAADPTSATRAATPPGGDESLVKTLLLATTGEITSDQRERRAALTLHNGTVHFLRSRNDPRYTVGEFGTMTLSMNLGGNGDSDLGDWRKTAIARTYGEIDDHVDALWKSLPESARLSPRSQVATLTKGNSVREKILDIWFLRAEQYSRISVALACFAFVLIGVPLAVYIRPSGKAVGISIAFALFMVYYGFLYSGVHLIRNGLPIGTFLVFLPIGLLLVLGAVFLYRVVRR